MEISIILAKILGLYLLIVSIAMLVRPNSFRELYQVFSGNIALTFVSGFLALIFGIVIISLHNIWAANWTLVITLIGWLALLKGIVRLFIPSSFDAMINTFERKTPYFAAAIVTLLLGLFFSYHGFLA